MKDVAKRNFFDGLHKGFADKYHLDVHHVGLLRGRILGDHWNMETLYTYLEAKAATAKERGAVKKSEKYYLDALQAFHDLSIDARKDILQITEFDKKGKNV